MANFTTSWRVALLFEVRGFERELICANQNGLVCVPQQALVCERALELEDWSFLLSFGL
jgi:hypothetical protein